MELVPFFDRKDRYPDIPHIRIGFLVYSRYLDWSITARTRHLFGRFWWRDFDWYYIAHWVGWFRFGLMYVRI